MSTESRSLSDALGDQRVAMLVTADLTSRPLQLAALDEGSLEFLVDEEADWVQDVRKSPEVGVQFSRPESGDFVALVGIAAVLDHRARIEALWGAGADAYFEGPNDRRVRLLTVQVTGGQYWDAANTAVGRWIDLKRVARSGDRSKAGEQGSVEA